MRQGWHINVSRSGPRWSGCCDDCGFLFDYSALQKQMQYQGNSLVWTGALVCPMCLNRPSEFLRPAILGPEPIPPPMPRPPSYAYQSQNIGPLPAEPLRLSIIGDDETP